MQSNAVVVIGWVLAWLLAARAVPAEEAYLAFLRGDVDETGSISVTDVVHTVYHVFVQDQAFTLPVRCEDAADANDDGAVDVSDAVHLLNGLFLGGPPPAAPFPKCGIDPTADGLGCERSDRCDLYFFGLSFAADSWFFVVSKTDTMRDAGELEISSREIIHTLARLPEGTEFGLVCFDSVVTKFPATGSPATTSPANVEQAYQFLDNITRGNESCVQQALIDAVGLAKLSRGPRKVIVYLGNGGGTCQGADEPTYLRNTLEAVATLNQGEVTIHAIGLLEPGPINEGFLEDLASQNGGTYTRHVRIP